MVSTSEKVFSSLQVICFKIRDEEYGIDILQVQEIQLIPQITKLPKSSGYIMGVIDLRGKVIPIIDLSKKFGLDSVGMKDSNRAIIIEINGKEVGLAIDSVSHVIKIDSEEIEPPPPIVKGITGKYIVGIAKIERGFVVILDIKRIFSTEELETL